MSDLPQVPPSTALLAWGFISTEEGGGKIHTRPGDPGGTTRWGFAQHFNQDIDVTTLTYRTAFERFVTHYWVPLQCERLPPAMGIALADYAFNAGADDAIPHLQQATGSRVDGIMGQRTVEAVVGRYAQNPGRLINDFLSYRCLKYASTGRSDDNRGWYVRVLKLRAFVEKL